MLRPYQQSASNEIDAAWASGARNVMLVSPTGSGKTVLFSHKIKQAAAPAIAIAHRQELVSQISVALGRNGVRHRVIAPANVQASIAQIHMMEFGRRFIDQTGAVAVAGVDTLRARGLDAAYANSVRLWVMDECFPAGTLIDGRPIETVRVGDVVTGFNEQTGEFEPRKVVRLFKNPMPKRMVRIVIGHHVLNCTPAHPIFTRRGWVNAADIGVNDEMLYVRQTCGHFGQSQIQRSQDGPGVLRQDMFNGLSCAGIQHDCGANKQAARIGQDDGAQSNEAPGIAGENGNDVEGTQSSAKDAGRQWARSNSGRGNAISVVRGAGLCQPASDQDGQRKGQRRLSVGVPAGLGQLDTEDCNRGGWGQSWRAEPSAAGLEKGFVSEWLGVDGVEVYQSADSDAARKGSCDGHVYNFEVDTLHTYIANGFVVHNCHHVLDGNKWGDAVNLFPNARGLGVTATPRRADGKGLGRHSDGVFDKLILGPGPRELIDAGYLSDYKLFCPPNDLDLSDVHIGASGEFVQKEVAKAVRRSHITGDVVQHYTRHAAGKLAVVFAVDIEEATRQVEAFRGAGVAAELITSKTPDTLRVAILRRFAGREITVLVNVDLFGEGFDLPAIEVVMMARPTESLSLYLQQFGRALRPMKGKPYAMIFDHVGNVARHKLPDISRLWSLDRRERGATRGTAEDLLPQRICPFCTRAYGGIGRTCPYCGHVSEPLSRSNIAHVDGVLHELDADVLAMMRAQADAIMGHEVANHPDPMIRASLRNRHIERQQAQDALRQAMARYGVPAAEGIPAEVQAAFYYRFGVDVLTAQTLARRDADKLTERIVKFIDVVGFNGVH